jgi:hypothetical protein
VPATVNANKLSVTHAGSSGINTIFPDVCKTPTPGGPVPIPYPNIAQSSDTADGSSTLKADGNPIMLKGSNYRMSTGDEAGSAMGIVSNKIKGKAEPLLYSFDVKVDGKNVFRLTDMMFQNVGTPNPPPGTNVEPPVIGMDPELPECKETKKKHEEQKAADTSWADSGVIGKHQGHIQTAATTHKAILWIRSTKAVCAPWISDAHQPKPHSCMNGTTITAAHSADVQAWLTYFFEKNGKGGRAGTVGGMPQSFAELSHSGSPSHKRLYSDQWSYFLGVIGVKVRSGWIRPLPGGGRQTVSYAGKWMTGDYDLFQVLGALEPCKPMKGEPFAKLKRDINKNCKWDAIQHPSQAQWKPNAKEQAEGVKAFDMNMEVAACMAGLQPVTAKVEKWHPKRGDMKIVDSPLAVVSGKGAMMAKTPDDVKETMVCQGCPTAADKEAAEAYMKAKEAASKA